MWQYYSTDGFYKIPIGNSTFDMPAVDDLRGGMSGFPDKASVEKLRYYGIKTVVLHLVMPETAAASEGYEIARAAGPGGGRRQADRRARHHAPAGRLARDLRDRPRARGAARTRLSDAASAEAPAGRPQGWAPGAGAPSSRPAAARARRRGGGAAVSARRCAAGCSRCCSSGLAFATMIQSFSWNQTSHYDLIRALDKDSTTIDPYQENTGDKVFYQRPLLLGARARPGAVLAALLRRAEPRRRRTLDRAHVARRSAATTR